MSEQDNGQGWQHEETGADHSVHRHPGGLTLPQAQELTTQAVNAAEDTRNMVRELRALLRRSFEPADLETIVFTAARPVAYSPAQVDDPSMSIGLLNPLGISIYLGIGGGSASLAGRALPAPPNSLIVLPVAPADIELAPDEDELAALLAGPPPVDAAVVWLLRFKTVQPAYLHRVA